VQYVVPPKASSLLPGYLFILGIVEGVWEQGAREKIGPKIQRNNTPQKIIA